MATIKTRKMPDAVKMRIIIKAMADINEILKDTDIKLVLIKRETGEKII